MTWQSKPSCCTLSVCRHTLDTMSTLENSSIVLETAVQIVAAVFADRYSRPAAVAYFKTAGALFFFVFLRTRRFPVSQSAKMVNAPLRCLHSPCPAETSVRAGEAWEGKRKGKEEGFCRNQGKIYCAMAPKTWRRGSAPEMWASSD